MGGELHCLECYFSFWPSEAEGVASEERCPQCGSPNLSSEDHEDVEEDGDPQEEDDG